MNILVDWTTIKAFATAKSLSIQYVDLNDKYYLLAFDGPFVMECTLQKDTHTAEVTEFEASYKSAGNKKINTTDSDGSQLARTKITTTGWHFQNHAIEFGTSKRAITYSKDRDGNDLGFATLKAYDSNDTEITTDLGLLNCVKTVLTWEPTHDFEMVGALLYQASAPATDVRVFTIGVPDVAYGSGGSRPFGTGGLNLKYLPAGLAFKADGRAPKYLTYNATYHTNKIQLTFKHDAAVNHNMLLVFEIFKA